MLYEDMIMRTDSNTWEESYSEENLTLLNLTATYCYRSGQNATMSQLHTDVYSQTKHIEGKAIPIEVIESYRY